MKPPKGISQLRKGRFSEAGRMYLITSSTQNRQPVFSDLYAARAAIASFHSRTVLRDSQLLSWVLMPDHVHWLLQLEGDRLSDLIKRMKSASAMAVNAVNRRSGSVWQQGYHDRAIRREGDIRPVARYIVANPLRAGLADQVGDYPHWDAVWL